MDTYHEQVRKQSAPIGRMNIDVQPVPGEPVPTARVTLTIHAEPQPLRLDGIMVRASRPGWMSLDVPLLETWQPALKCLPKAQRERIESPEFYELLNQQLTQRFLRSLPPPG